MEIVKFVCLVVGIMFTGVNGVNLVRGHCIPGMNFIIWAVACAGFIWLQWLTK